MHTKGKWEAQKNRKHRGENDIDTFSVVSGRDTVASVCGRSGITNEANARLISAAPDLLEAAIIAENALSNCGPERLLDTEEQAARDMLRAAIQKAKGA